MIDDEWTYMFVRSVGIAWHAGAWGGGTLVWASIGGMTVTSTEPSAPPEADIQIFPNPVQDRLNVVCDVPAREVVDVRVIDATGRVAVEANRRCGEEALDVSDLSSGLYLLQILTADGSHGRPFIVTLPNSSGY